MEKKSFWIESKLHTNDHCRITYKVIIFSHNQITDLMIKIVNMTNKTRKKQLRVLECKLHNFNMYVKLQWSALKAIMTVDYIIRHPLQTAIPFTSLVYFAPIDYYLMYWVIELQCSVRFKYPINTKQYIVLRNTQTH